MGTGFTVAYTMKPIVHYKFEIYPEIRVGWPVTGIIPVDHPNDRAFQRVTNTKNIVTSPVVRVGSWGEFETENTIYRPCTPLNDED